MRMGRHLFPGQRALSAYALFLIGISWRRPLELSAYRYAIITLTIVTAHPHAPRWLQAFLEVLNFPWELQ